MFHVTFEKNNLLCKKREKIDLTFREEKYQPTPLPLDIKWSVPYCIHNLDSTTDIDIVIQISGLNQDYDNTTMTTTLVKVQTAYLPFISYLRTQGVAILRYNDVA